MNISWTRKFVLKLFLFVCFVCAVSPEAIGQQTVQYFPQVVDGGGYVTTFYIVGLESGSSTVVIDFFQQNGTPLSLQTNRGTGSKLTVSVGPNAEISLRTMNASTTVSVGWARITSPQRVGATELLQLLASNGNVVSQAGVLPADPTGIATLVASVDGRSRNTGVAMVNVSSSVNLVTLTLYDQSGAAVATSTVSLDVGNQISRFINELPGFEQVGVIEGSIGISASSSITLVTLVLDGGQLSTLPILPGRISGIWNGTGTLQSQVTITVTGGQLAFVFGLQTGGCTTFGNRLSSIAIVNNSFQAFQAGFILAANIKGTFTSATTASGTIEFFWPGCGSDVVSWQATKQ